MNKENVFLMSKIEGKKSIIFTALLIFNIEEINKY
jgi:hypothetical protein